jgi:hypothetical protein
MEPKSGLDFQNQNQNFKFEDFGSTTRFSIPFMCETGIDTILMGIKTTL